MANRADYERVVRAARRKELTWNRASIRRMDKILRSAAKDVKTQLRAVIGTGKLSERYLSSLLSSLHDSIDGLMTEYRTILPLYLLGSAQIVIDREVDVLHLAESFVAQHILEDMVASITRTVQIASLGEVSVTFGRVAEDAVNAVYQRIHNDGLNITDRLWRMDKITRQDMEDKIVQAIANQKSARELARDLRKYLTAEGQGNARYNTMRLARTEIASAHREGHIWAVTDDDGDLRDYISAIGWRLSMSHPKPDICCRKGTLITTSQGDKRIEDVAVGDLVLTHKRRYAPVTRLYQNTIPAGSLVRLRFQLARSHIREVVLTPNHPVLTAEGWIPAGELQTGYLGVSAFSVFSEQQSRLGCDAYRKASSNSGGNEPSQHARSESAGRYDAGTHYVRRILRIHRQAFELPNRIRRFASDTYQHFYQTPSSLGFLFQCAIERALCGVQQFARRVQDDACHSWDYPYLLMESSTASSICDYWNMGRIPFYMSGRRKPEPYAQLNSSLSSNTYLGAVVGLWPLRIASCKWDKWLQFDCSAPSIEQRTNDCRSVAYSIGQVVSFHGLAAREVYRNVRTALRLYASGIGSRILDCKIGALAKTTAFHRSVAQVIDCIVRKFLDWLSYVQYSILSNKHTTIIQNIEIIDSSGETVYNLGVAEDNSYFANGLAVHNCDVWASQDIDGLGAGNYLPENVPIDHPHGLCFTVTILKDYPEMQFVSKEPRPEDVHTSLSEDRK
jgi:hypothetical protein